ncbi:hypothetical protein M409DRAFT_16834 [Zasmidium cellare ATCC 36951]|uniref:F-box domain-containing protein n=1 Tax=Zasmidium cellare ATCC 36951 TaxID=1080233 RepID=A0A6A6D3B0_ZASCE|nr:uncharacterized protein M409DRAFT_16834 [Zasmidium cellare ATCC 36951]KAF2172880.1 hypothetical protein M409DRAFT_16834 [Zasmidium cellare ATCC 36951]
MSPSAAMAMPSSAPGIKKASLLGLPSELRLLILEEVFPPDTVKDMWPSFLIGNSVYDAIHRYSNHLLPPKLTSILSTNRLLHAEGLKVLYSHSNVQVDLTLTDHPSVLSNRRAMLVHRIDRLSLWPHVRNLKLTVKLHRFDCAFCGRWACNLDVLVKALERGKNIRKLHVRVDWEDHKALPLLAFEETILALENLRMPDARTYRTEVVVDMAGDMDIEEKTLVEERMRDVMLSGVRGREPVRLGCGFVAPELSWKI